MTLAEQARAGRLTVLLPTRNRPHNLKNQFRLFTRAGYPTVVADSSDDASWAAVKEALPPGVAIERYPSETTLFAKLAQASAAIETPFVLLAADRKIALPDAVGDALAFLERQNAVAAAGYVLGFENNQRDIDIYRVAFFTPSIREADPLQRHYHLMRRYQPWVFSLFRTEVLRAAAEFAQSLAGGIFQEVGFVSAVALQGKMARLPSIFTLETPERSFRALHDRDPFHWFLHDSRAFFRQYARYREALAAFIAARAIAVPAGTDLRQLLDTVHGVWLHFNFDNGTLNQAARFQLGQSVPPVEPPSPPRPRRSIDSGDIVRARRPAGRYLWRREVIEAGPEVRISLAEIERTERQLDLYFAPASL
jgi:glycosyltransferase domain-containing protein